MPQPLSRVAPNASIVVGNAGDRPIARHPDLAVLAMEAIASWSNVENFMLGLFLELFGGHSSLAAEVFLSLEGRAAKLAAINAAATSVLKDRDEELRVLRAILAIVKTNEKDRNKLTHWIWGDSPNLPDALLLVDPRTTLGKLDHSDVYVYRAQDFIAITQANDRLCGYGLQFRYVLQNHVANIEGLLLAELLSEREIQERIEPQ